MTDLDFNHDQVPLGMLCIRSEFLTFHDMVACLITVNSTVEVICNGINQCLRAYEGSELRDHNISPGSRGERTMILLQILLNANADVTKY